MKFASLILLTLIGAQGYASGIHLWFSQNVGCHVKPCNYSVAPPDKITSKKIALTFDDGPSAETTPAILDVLDKHHIKATFFVLGKNVAGNEALLQRMKSRGHIIGAHSWNHPSFWSLNKEEIDQQIMKTESALAAIGIYPKFFRFPYGNSNEYAQALLRKLGYKVVGWNVDTCDWGFNKSGVLSSQNNKICNGSTATVTDALPYLFNKATARQGGIILMHDVHEVTARNLDHLLTELEYQGYDFVQVDDPAVFPLLNQ